ncbi:MAG TPA: hypothetical protein VGP41_03760 [Candidatus Lustribacter sp.]|nr:hypothetical protein [Candidatus Lustribacter sp.]
MRFRIAAFFVSCGAACALACAAPAAAASAVVTVTSTTLAFDAVNMSNTALTSAPATATAQVTFTTTPGGAGGTVTVMPVNLTGTPGGTLDARDFTLTCKRTGANNGFVAAASAPLNGATTCGTLTQGKTNVTSTFTIEFTLNTTTTATVPFGAATFTGIFTVTATAS